MFPILTMPDRCERVKAFVTQIENCTSHAVNGVK